MRGSEELCLAQWRAALLGNLSGSVLEVGAGTGANLPHYRSELSLTLAEPDPHMRRQLESRIERIGAGHVQVTDGNLDALPFADARYDIVVATLVLCSVANQAQALGEIYRVLKPGGQLVFIEHVCAPDNPQRLRWQRRVEPVWKRVFGNCHLTRDTTTSIREAGFTIAQIEAASIRKAVAVARPSIRGIARRP